MKHPKVSIIIPCYNAVETIKETLTSIEKQTNKDFEVIFINDGSKDDTLAILTDFQKKSSFPVVVIDKDNAGVSAARNDGIHAASGEYIAFLDADDIYHEAFIDAMLTTAENLQVDTVYCKLTRNLSKISLEDRVTAAETADEAMKRLLFQMGEYGFYCYLYRTKILREFNIVFDENTKYGEDREFIWKYMVHCRSFAHVNSTMYGYRDNPGSATRKKANWRRTDSLQAVKRVEQYMINQKVEFYPIYKDYMYARDMWAVAKAFAITGAKECFDRLVKEYDVSASMKRTAKDQSVLVSLASKLYLLHPNLFYFCIRLKR